MGAFEEAVKLIKENSEIDDPDEEDCEVVDDWTAVNYTGDSSPKLIIIEGDDSMDDEGRIWPAKYTLMPGDDEEVIKFVNLWKRYGLFPFLWQLLEEIDDEV